MFIVAVTLGLLAAMGVYGMSAASSDIRNAGHGREALQAERAGEHALITTAETFNPKTSSALVALMTGGDGKQAKSCRTAKAYTGEIKYRPAEACIKLDATEMKKIADGKNTSAGPSDPVNPVNPWVTEPFLSTSFGGATVTPTMRIEVTNPIDLPPPPGTDANLRFAQVTVTVFMEMRKDSTSEVDSVVAGRGRLTVGPILGPEAFYSAAAAAPPAGGP